MPVFLTRGSYRININTVIKFISDCKNDKYIYDQVTMDKSLKTLFNIHNESLFTIFQNLVKQDAIHLTRQQLIEHENGNPIYASWYRLNKYNRAMTSASSYDWRIYVDRFHSRVLKSYLETLKQTNFTIIQEDQLGDAFYLPTTYRRVRTW